VCRMGAQAGDLISRICSSSARPEGPLRFWPANLRVPIVFGRVIVAMSCSLPSPVQKILPHFTGTRARCSVARQDVTCKHEIEQDGIGLAPSMP
jgi:hypothetical protein